MSRYVLFCFVVFEILISHFIFSTRSIEIASCHLRIRINVMEMRE